MLLYFSTFPHFRLRHLLQHVMWLSIPDAWEVCACFDSHVGVRRYISSSQTKQFPDKRSFTAGNRWKTQGVKSRCKGCDQTCPETEFCRNNRYFDAVCSRVLSWWKITPLLRMRAPICRKHFGPALYALVLNVRQWLPFRSNTHDESLNAVAKNLAVFGAILYFFLGQPGCLYSMVYRFMLGLLRMPVSSRDFTALSVSFARIRLQATLTSYYSYRFLSSVNLRGIHSTKTLWNCDMFTMTFAQCHRIHHSQMPYAAVFLSCPLIVFPDARIVICSHRQLSSCTSLSLVTPFLSYANVWHHLANYWLDVTLLPYTSRNCRRTSAAENVLEHI